jgi:hypothetical protein
MTPHPLAVIISDTHFGGFTAVSPPEVQTHDGNIVRSNGAQAWMYSLWLQDFKAVKERAKGRRVIVIHDGDIIEGEHHDALAHLPDVQDQEALAVSMLTPWRNLADKFYLIKGTEAHAGNQHMSERRIARELAATALDFHLRLDVGVLCDFAHHSTGTPRTIGLQVLEDCARDNLPVPRYVFRGHRHNIVDSGDTWPQMRVLTLPSWQLRTSYGWKIAPNKRADIGLVILDQGQIEIIRHSPRPDPIRRA